MEYKNRWNWAWVLMWVVCSPVLFGCLCLWGMGPPLLEEVQEGFIVQIRVIDAQSGEPIPSVSIQTRSYVIYRGPDGEGENYAQTDQSGLAKISVPKVSKQEWYVHKEGYQRLHLNFSVESDFYFDLPDEVEDYMPEWIQSYSDQHGEGWLIRLEKE